jgi:thiol-disulfide isomerase/thioredoxin
MKWILLFLFLGWSAEQTSTIKVYEKFSEFDEDYLQDLSADTTYVINFWATWCAPCVKELPYFEQLREVNKDKPVKVVLVSLDFKSQVDKGVKPLVKRLGIESEVIVLADGKSGEWIDKVDSTWSGAIPATVVIREGERHFYEKSYESYEELENELIKTN